MAPTGRHSGARGEDQKIAVVIAGLAVLALVFVAFGALAAERAADHAAPSVEIRLRSSLAPPPAPALAGRASSQSWVGSGTPIPRGGAGMSYDPTFDRSILFGGVIGTDLGDTWIFDLGSNAWTNASPAPGPAAREYMSFADQAGAQQVVLFGGHDRLQLLGDTWAYDLASNTWRQLSAGGGPSPRLAAAFAYDAIAHRFVLAGGLDGNGGRNDTWSLDPATGAWTALAPALAPPPLFQAPMAYDPVTGRMVVLAASAPGPRAQTWSFDLTTDTWTNLTLAVAPPRGLVYSLGYDSTSDRVLAVGVGSSRPTETWSYDAGANAWTNESPRLSPGPRFAVSGAFDSGHERFLLFGGAGQGSVFNTVWSYDPATRTWTSLNPVTPPPAREYAAEAFASASNRSILFGGDYKANGTLLGDTWSYAYATGAWTEMFPSTAPPARTFASAAYDPASDRVLLFGGGAANLAVLRNDTWSYDPAANAWTNRSPVRSPSPRAGADLVYDAAAGRLFLFGGLSSSGYLNDTWSFDPLADMWTNVSSAVAPSIRGWAGAALDSATGRIVLYGGFDSLTYLNDTWTFDPASLSWTNVTAGASPPGLYDPSLAYDASADRVVLFGGSNAGGDPIDTWSFDSGTASWSLLRAGTAVVTPPGRTGQALVYDASAARVLLFGGGSLAPTNDTWVLETRAAAWTRMDRAAAPPVLGSPRLVYDSAEDRLVEVGSLGSTPLEAWALDLSARTWTNLTPALGPPPRDFFDLLYDPVADRSFLFGGSEPVAPYERNDTWAFDLATDSWTNVTPAVSPPGRDQAAMAYDSASDRVILACGENETGFLNDTWSYDAGAGAWTRRTPTSAPFCVATDMAYDSAADRTVLLGYGSLGVVTSSEGTWSYDLTNDSWADRAPATQPTVIGVYAAMYDPVADRTLLFGGFLRSGFSADLWSYAFASNAWVRLGAAVTPSPRSHPAGAYDLAADRTVIVGGFPAPEPYTDAWTYAYPGLPGPPAGLSASPGDSSVVLSWAAPASDGGASLTGYRIYRGTTPGGETLLATVGTGTSYADGSLTNGATYVYAVAAVSGAGEGPRSAEATAVPRTTPAAPSGVQASPGDAQVGLAWSPAASGGSPVTNYTLYRGTASGGETFLATLGNVTSYTDAGLTNGATYFYEVSARNAAGEGPRSGEASATPAPGADTVAPTITIAAPVAGSTLNTTSVSVRGTASDNIGVSRVELSTDGVSWSPATGTTAWSGTVVLQAGANTIYARATDTSGNRATDSVSVTVGTSGAPGAPSGLPDWALPALLVAVLAIAIALVLVVLLRRRKRDGPGPPAG